MRGIVGRLAPQAGIRRLNKHDKGGGKEREAVFLDRREGRERRADALKVRKERRKGRLEAAFRHPFLFCLMCLAEMPCCFILS